MFLFKNFLIIFKKDSDASILSLFYRISHINVIIKFVSYIYRKYPYKIK